MKSKGVWILSGINLLLLGWFLAQHLRDNTAHAQGVASRPGEYMIIPGSITGISSEVVYVIDSLNGMMGAVVFDVSNGRLDTMPAEDLNRVFQPPAAPGGVQPGTTPRSGMRR